MKVTHFSRAGLPLALGGWSTGVISVGSNFNTVDGGFSATNFVQGITANGSNMLLRPIANIAAGSNILLTIDSGPGGSIPSNTIRIHSTSGGGGNIITANGSNSLAAVVNLKAGTGIALGVSGQDVTITNTVSAGGGGGGGGASGALVLLEQHTASASATLDFTTFISATYDTYMFELIQLRPATNAVELYVRAGTGGGPTWDAGANYGWLTWRFVQTGGNAIAGAGTGNNEIRPTGNGSVKNGTNEHVTGEMKLYDPAGGVLFPRFTHQVQYVENGSSLFIHSFGSSIYNSATAMTGVRFLFSAGNITSGLIRAYGITKT